MAKYVYPAVFVEEENGVYQVDFPDIKNCFTQGEDLADAVESARDVLCLMLCELEDRQAPIPHASHLKDIKAGEQDIVSLIDCDTLAYRKKNNSTAVKKTLSIPMWLNTLAEEKGVNFSQILQDALKSQLHVG